MKRKQAIRRGSLSLELVQMIRRRATGSHALAPSVPQDAAGIAAVCMFWLLFVFTVFANAQP